MLAIKGFRQTDDSRCGPACVKMVLDYWGIRKSEDLLCEACNHTYGKGCTNQDMVRAFRTYGLVADYTENNDFLSVKQALRRGIPPIVDWFSLGTNPTRNEMPNGHASIIVDLDDAFITLMDPEDGQYRTIPRNEFKRVWFDWDKVEALNKPDQINIRGMILAYPDIIRS